MTQILTPRPKWKLKTKHLPVVFATGCSFTTEQYKSSFNFKTAEHAWPWYVRDHISETDGQEYELLNVANPGKSFEYMTHTLTKAIARYGDRIKYVLVGGTEWCRFPIVHANDLVFTINGKLRRYWEAGDWPGKISKDMKSIGANDWLKNPNAHNIISSDRWVQSHVDSAMNQIFTCYLLAQSINAKFIFGQIMGPSLNFFKRYVRDVGNRKMFAKATMDDYDETNDYQYIYDEARDYDEQWMMKAMTDTVYFWELEKIKKHFINWPFVMRYGGQSIAGQYKVELGGEATSIAWPDDTHPNTTAHKYIADKFIEVYNNVHANS